MKYLTIIPFIFISVYLNAQKINIDIGEYIIQWLDGKEEIKENIVWGELYYPNDSAFRNDLKEVIRDVYHEKKILHEPQYIENNVSYFSDADAKRVYLENVAISLILEAFQLLPWSNSNLPNQANEVYHHSLIFWVNYPKEGIALARWLDSRYMPSNPLLSFNTMMRLGLVGNTRQETVYRIGDWAKRHLIHFTGSNTKETRLLHWKDDGIVKLNRVLLGTPDKKDSNLVSHYTLGCFGTSSFFNRLSRILLIPSTTYSSHFITANTAYAHITVCYPQLDLNLVHGDDPYGKYNTPIEKTFINNAQFDYYNNNDITGEEKLNRWSEFSLINLMNYPHHRAVNNYCSEKSNEIPDSSTMIAHDFYSAGYTFQEITETGIFSKLNDIINDIGSCEIPKDYNFKKNKKADIENFSTTLLNENIVIDTINATVNIYYNQKLYLDTVFFSYIISGGAKTDKGNHIHALAANNSFLMNVTSEDGSTTKTWEINFIADDTNNDLIKEYNITLCEGESFMGRNKAGQYSLFTRNDDGTDSVYTYNIQMVKGSQVSEHINICNGESYETWSITGEYQRILKTSMGCDSIVTTNLTVYELPDPDFTFNGDTLISTNNHATYQWYDQNGMIEGAISSRHIIENSGTYYLEATNENGCTAISEGVAGTPLSGSISGTLRCSDSPFVVTNDIIVEKNDSLIIEPCVDIYFAEGTRLIVHGVLLAKGNENTNDTIRFAASSPESSWGGLYIRGTAELEMCRFQHLNQFVVATQTSFPLKHVYIKNCDFTNINTSKKLLFFTNNFDVNVSVEACRFYNIQASAIIAAEAVNELTISNTLIFNNTGTILYGTHKINLKVVNSTFYNNRVLDIEKTPGIFMQSACNLELVNSIHWNPEAPQIISRNLYWDEFGKNSLVIRNSIVYYPDNSLLTTIGTDLKWSSNITNDPQLSESEDYHYSLNSTSPAIDSGTNSIVDFPFDINKNIRIWDGNNDNLAVVDIGCFEYASVSCRGMHTTQEVAICEGESYNGWTSQGEYTRNLVAANGCDSTVVTTLSVLELPVPEFSCLYDTLSCNESFSSYQWHDQNGKIEGATTSQFIIEKSGTYYLEVANANGCTSVSEGMTVLKTSARKPEEFDFDVVVMPNPANDYIRVRITNGKPGKYRVQLINGSGQVLHPEELILSGETHEVELNVSHFSKGNYFVRVKNGNKRKIKKVLLK